MIIYSRLKLTMQCSVTLYQSIVGSEENLALSRQDLHQQNPGLIPFSKMVTVGVPIEAITQKLKMHGFEDIVIESFIDLHQNKK